MFRSAVSDPRPELKQGLQLTDIAEDSMGPGELLVGHEPAANHEAPQTRRSS